MKKNSYPGKFIVIEGLDGSGQTTQVNLLKDFLIGKGYQLTLTKEPTLESEAGKKIRGILDEKEKIEAAELQKLFAQDRKEHLENTIIPALQKGSFVISDRYFFSSFAYGAADGLDLNKLIKINDDFLLPDLTIILKVSPDVCVSRIKKRGTERTLFEKRDKLAEVWRIYATFPKKFEDVFIIDGEKTIDGVFEEIKKVISLNLLR